MNTIYLQAYFVTIACILGTGILGLPVTLYNCGFYPFLVVFIIAIFMQVLVIYLVVEIMQRAHAIQIKYDKVELLPLREMLDEDTCDELEDQPENGGPVLAGHVILSKQKGVRSVDLHLLGEMFLCFGISHIFDLLIILNLMSMLTVYSLAGSEAYGELLKVRYIYVIPVFTWCLAFLIIFAINLIQPIVSVLTFIKASLFTMAVIVTFFVTSAGKEDVENDFRYIDESFLMTTVALGGSFFVMPFLFRKIDDDASQILKYRFAIIMGLLTCGILNILWCWAVVDLVPQHCPPVIESNRSFHSHRCNSLESAKINGEISTEPLTNIIHLKYPSFSWVAFIVEVFIMISITVSFMTIGTAMRDILGGIVESNFPDSSISTKRLDIGKKCISSVISIMLFGIIFTIAMLNPKGFLSIMEKFTSSSLNITNMLIFVMFMRTRKAEIRKLEIPLPISNKLMPFIYMLPFYYGLAVGYDIYYTLKPYFHHEPIITHPTTTHWDNSSLFNVTTHSPIELNTTSL